MDHLVEEIFIGWWKVAASVVIGDGETEVLPFVLGETRNKPSEVPFMDDIGGETENIDRFVLKVKE